ncbi:MULTISPECIES: hypothetical protein [unclassified Anabaena]|uniref:hypothetical protein n=1 Tax=unclassified Anabaena TaxID=2619674 RepID=UPI00083349E4|nr:MULTISPECIES: hypothetical protein [unclassified Anabaena]
MSFLSKLYKRQWRLRIFAVLASLIATLLFTLPATSSFPTTRDKFQWPFSSTSIWNMPLGSGARYIPAKIQKAGRILSDDEHFFQVNTADPKRPVYANGSWTQRCSGSNFLNFYLPIPDSLIVPDATLEPYSTPNNVSAFLMPDGQTLVQLSPLARCVQGGPIYGQRYSPDVNIYGQGIGGAHFGSGLSSIGGSIRKGELTGSQPIRHTLKLLLWAKKYLYYSASVPGYRWPADRADSYAATTYGGTNPALVEGTLLAIPPFMSESTLQLKTPAAKKIFHALQDYGGYVVDDAAWDAHYIAMEKGVTDEFRQAYGYEFNTSTGVFYEDMMRIFQNLYIINNNGPNSIGGGGSRRRAPLAPPIGN